MKYVATKKPLKIKADGTQIDIPVEYKEYESHDEFHNDCGGQEASLKVINRWGRHFSLSDGRNTGNSQKKAEGESISDFISKVTSKVKDAVRNHIPSTGRGPSQKAMAEGYQTVMKGLSEIIAEYAAKGEAVPPDILQQLVQEQVNAAF